MGNRITAAIRRMKTQIEERIALGLTTKEKVDATAKALDMDIEEHYLFQEKKTLAASRGKLTNEEGMLVYRLLGETVCVFNSQPVEVKYVLTGLFKELLGG